MLVVRKTIRELLKRLTADQFVALMERFLSEQTEKVAVRQGVMFIMGVWHVLKQTMFLHIQVEPDGVLGVQPVTELAQTTIRI